MPELHIKAFRYHSLGPIDLAIASGECVSLTGPSGSGKTLLLRALADLDPHTGAVRLDQTVCEELPAPDWRRRVAYLPTESQWWLDTVGAHFAGEPRDLLKALGFAPETLDWAVSRLSSGERQRLALARLLAQAPAALLLDEPTASLDPESARLVEELVEDYRAEHAAPVLWITHNLSQGDRVASRHFKIADGALREVKP